MQSRNARLGIVLFAVYLVFYAGFVLIAAFWPETMEREPWAGVNLAIWYGFGLIVAAFVLAIFYGWACRNQESQTVTENAADLHSDDRPGVRPR